MLRRLIPLIGAAALACGALLAPPWWQPLAGQLSFTGPLPVADAVRGPALPLPLVSQYQSLATDNVNCGPAAVAAALRYVRPHLGAMSDAALVGRARAATGIASGDTYLPSLVRAFSSFGVPSAPLFAADGGSDDPLRAIGLALAHGRPVIATVGGVALGRGAAYGDHFVLIIGMDPRTEQLDVIDPDTQAAHAPSWMPGGRQTWPASLARAALAAAKERDALAVVVGAEREGALAPATAFLLASAALALCGWITLAGRESGPPRHGTRGYPSAW